MKECTRMKNVTKRSVCVKTKSKKKWSFRVVGLACSFLLELICSKRGSFFFLLSSFLLLFCCGALLLFCYLCLGGGASPPAGTAVSKSWHSAHSKLSAQLSFHFSIFFFFLLFFYFHFLLFTFFFFLFSFFSFPFFHPHSTLVLLSLSLFILYSLVLPARLLALQSCCSPSTLYTWHSSSRPVSSPAPTTTPPAHQAAALPTLSYRH